MTPQLKNLLIILGAISVVLIVIIMCFGEKSALRVRLRRFLEADPAQPAQHRAVSNSKVSAPADEYEQKSTSEPIVVMATLIRKSDEHRRVIESSGKERLENEYYELIFVTRKGKKLKIGCSAEAYPRVPFNQQGSLTYKRNTLVKFKYYEDTVLN